MQRVGPGYRSDYGTRIRQRRLSDPQALYFNSTPKVLSASFCPACSTCILLFSRSASVRYEVFHDRIPSSALHALHNLPTPHINTAQTNTIDQTFAYFRRRLFTVLLQQGVNPRVLLLLKSHHFGGPTIGHRVLVLLTSFGGCLLQQFCLYPAQSVCPWPLWWRDDGQWLLRFCLP